MSDKQLPKVGDCWDEAINQGMRTGYVVAVDVERGQYLWEYEMPKGSSALVLYGSGKYGRRTVSYTSLSDRWLRLIEEQGHAGIAGLCGNPQSGKQAWFRRLAAFRVAHPELFDDGQGVTA